jgi:ribosomal protein L35
MLDAFAKTHKMAKQKFRPTRLGGFSGAKAYIRYVQVLKKRRNAVGRTFCDAIMLQLENFSIWLVQIAGRLAVLCLDRGGGIDY